MAILGYQTNFSRMNLENSQNFALFRYFLIPFAIFLTVVPTGILSLMQQYQQNQSVLTYTTIISQEFSQDNTANGDNSSGGVVLTPNLTLKGDFVCVTCAWIITWIGIFGFLRKNNLIGQFISVFLIAFTVLQTLSAIYTVIFSDQWILEILSGSWKKAYLFDSELIKENQCEFSCKEFVLADDGPKNMLNQPYQFDECCSKTLINRFGTQLFDVTKMILLARFVQLFGVLLHTHIFNRVILNDMKTMYAEECDAEYYYDDKEHYNDYISSDELDAEYYDDILSDELDAEYYYDDISSDELEDDDGQYDDQYDDWIDSPKTSLLLSKIYFGEQTS